ncbi:MAG: amidohydrolase family protein [Gemmatimonadales bacterium]|nr:amidohydrolase family protein [Gemmatimonadales bacterium]NIN09996.1 amidohydrolase family protein [Gemmatimonadales bacterium]NIR01342.1 amidohydrolase family protein [Gemmatimonadales bacterium]NIS65254.1 amidohydrolase family protein [Gemmatimonadales bacterium]
MFQRIALLCGAVSVLSCSRVSDYATFPKIDAHVHIDTFKPDFVMMARDEGFRLMTLVTRSGTQEHIDREFAWARSQHESFPETVAFATTISMEDWGDPAWEESTISRLRRDFDNGANAVKLWKDIGMTFRDRDGSFIMIDNPRFDPILDYIASRGRPVIGHFGEPRNCWLPVDSMTVPGDSSYFTNNPQYHMYLHPEYPSYADQIDARDKMLAKHPDLTFVGAHLGSLEWDVGELAERLDRFPKMAVDMAARISHLQIQDRDSVREFMIEYQDRLLYGSDVGVSERTEALEWIAERWRRDWLYFTTDSVLTSPEVRSSFVGLRLPVSVLRKIYYQNAENWLGM